MRRFFYALFLLLAGAFSTFVTIAILLSLSGLGTLFVGGAFGVVIVICLALDRVAEWDWQVTQLFGAAALAYGLGIFTAMLLQRLLPEDVLFLFPHDTKLFMGVDSPVALFGGGVVGAFVVLIGALGVALWSPLHSLRLTGPTQTATADNTDLFCSTHFLWQVGMAVVIGMLMQAYRPRRSDP